MMLSIYRAAGHVAYQSVGNYYSSVFRCKAVRENMSRLLQDAADHWSICVILFLSTLKANFHNFWQTHSTGICIKRIHYA